MHSAAFGALSLCVGMRHGFDSLVFTLALALTAMSCVDIWNVKRAHFQHAEILDLVIERIRPEPADPRARTRLSFTPVDVLMGVIFGCAVALFLV